MVSNWRRGSQGSRTSVISEGGLVEVRECATGEIEVSRNGVQEVGLAEGLSGESDPPKPRNSTPQPPVLSQKHLQESEALSDDAFVDSAVSPVAPFFAVAMSHLCAFDMQHYAQSADSTPPARPTALPCDTMQFPGAWCSKAFR